MEQQERVEATSDYWKPPFYVLEAHGLDVWLVNAKNVKHLAGWPKTDRLDAVWLCKVAERQMIRPSFVPPPPIRRLRDLTRYGLSWSGGTLFAAMVRRSRRRDVHRSS
ncbi:transposase [Aeromicrobium sp.]|uniref:IS110 family transposase n=1 Tax=Aeromicrobium sp. TaxID=1871063 RepID=UPI0025BD74AD|nr:transposase [Aeromicrobium sp.]